MAERARPRPVGRTWAARQPGDLGDPVARPAGSEAEPGHRGAEDRDRRRPDRLSEVQRRAVVRHEERGPANDFGGLPHGEPAAGVDRPRPPSTALYRPYNLLSKGR